MDIQELKRISSEFLNTYNYIGKNVGENAILFSRPTGIGIADELIVYYHESNTPEEITKNLDLLTKQFKRIPGDEETTRRFFLSNEKLPVSNLPIIKKHGFKYQLPIQFFDREFNTRQKTPLKIIEDEAQKVLHERISQPYYKSLFDEPKKSSEVDILNEIYDDILNANQPRLRIIIAPAGYGKTVLMNSLYLKLLKKFKDKKQALGFASRPLLMLPGHIKRANDLDSLINNFIGDEYDYGVVSDKTFKFWIKYGLIVWLLDGLEELILKIADPEEFIYDILDDYIYTSNSNQQIIISIRKPLLASHPEMLQVIEEWKKGLGITTYELTDWKDEQYSKYFIKTLNGTNEDIVVFTQEIDTNNTLKNLCQVPYYCSLIADLKNSGSWKTFQDEIELVQHAVESICEREYGKGLDKEFITLQDQIELFSTMAVEAFKQHEGVLSKDDFDLWIELPLTDLDNDIKREQKSCLERHSVLAPFRDYIGYIQDIVRDFFLAKGLLDSLLIANLDCYKFEPLEMDNFVFKYLSKYSSNINWEKIFGKLWTIPDAFSKDLYLFNSILKIYLSSNEPQKEEKLNDQLCDKNLDGIIFENLNFKNFNFEGSSLKSSRFINTGLEGVNFNRCSFKETYFSKECNMKGATTMDVIFESIRTEEKLISDHKEIIQYLSKRTEIPITEKIHLPCQASINFKKVIEKFTRKRKGHLIRTNFVKVAPDGDKIIKYGKKEGFILEEGESLKLRINMYQELFDFAKELKCTPKICGYLDDLCDQTSLGCKHIPQKN